MNRPRILLALFEMFAPTHFYQKALSNVDLLVYLFKQDLNFSVCVRGRGGVHTHRHTHIHAHARTCTSVHPHMCLSVLHAACVKCGCQRNLGSLLSPATLWGAVIELRLSRLCANTSTHCPQVLRVLRCFND